MSRPAPYPDFDGTQNCAGDDLERFFAPPGHHGTATEQAKEICAGCPFLDPCLAYALARSTVYGIWGGATQDERAYMRRHGMAA